MGFNALVAIPGPSRFPTGHVGGIVEAAISAPASQPYNQAMIDRFPVRFPIVQRNRAL